MRRRLLVGLVVAVAALLFGPIPNAHAVSDEVVYHRITFPVAGPVTFGNDWGDCRSGCARQHQGNDLMGNRLQPLLATADGRVRWVRVDGNNMISLRGDDGWTYSYIHVNNDTPGTDDGANPLEWILAPGISVGSRVVAGQHIGFLGDSGNAEGTAPHLHFEIHKPDGSAVNPYWSLLLSQGRPANDRCRFDDNPVGTPSIEAAPGYWTTATDGSVYSFGGAPFFGSMGGRPLAAPVIGLEATANRGGYWQLAADGGIFSFGNAKFFGSSGGERLRAPVVGMTRTPSGRGYWLVASDGGVFTYGDARFLGSTGARVLNRPVAAMAATPTGGGYWLVASDGGVFAFGDAAFFGSTGGTSSAPVVDIASTPSGMGYWLTTATGSVLPFGDAVWHGGSDAIGFCEPPAIVGLRPTQSGGGYWLQAADGNVFAFGDAVDHGSAKRVGAIRKPAVALASA